ncbi:helix-turn-helix transcriptional regulator [Providencia vermicola]|uniref:helix-turn-helix domain-containing protein n=1 Tax=Providencia vermicola TaxID=333965 RepID=UPI0032DA8639
MKYKTLNQIHSVSMHDPEYRAAYEAEEALEKLQETLQSWRIDAGLTSAEVAERMGVKPPTVSRMEKNATKMSYETLLRYARACGVNFKLQQV